jgi:ribulose-phosphate 3-epimerase
VLEYTLDKVDMILLMSVNPGFGGQKFIPYVLDKARHVSQIIKASGRDIRLEIDGGVGPANIREIAEAGVDTFVAGSAVFGAAKASDPNHYDTIIKALRDELAQAKAPESHTGGCCGGGHH